jgi:dehydrogenase/reductase SDR family member 12
MQRDLSGKTALVTGANQGIGFQVSLDLARRGDSVVMACRSRQRGEEAADRIRREAGNNAVVVAECDVSDLDSVKALGQQFEAEDQKVHFLVLNAGVMVLERKAAPSGHESSFATNTLGSWAVARALEPALLRAAPSRIVFVSSGGALTEPLIVDDLDAADMGRRFDGQKQYARDKRRQIALAESLAAQLGPRGVLTCSAHPGWVATEGVKEAMPGFYNSLQDKLRTLEQGADTVVWLCLEDSEKIEAGGFYLDRHPQGKHLVMGGTRYGAGEPERLAAKLDGMLAEAWNKKT